ncbi:response regulator [Maribellus comscasis]|uniref:Response regulator n=1 Tax=Maribellus comscasis TaxID=2681766 RepID=A0A6I6K094_9BACT|nr:response regulator [Maribellus comscasis]QGY46860.1 response regulator [Maribellus comscasis]
MNNVGKILYAEDNDNDVELTLAAFEECNLANPVDVVKDGAEALDYLFYKGKYSQRDKEIPLFILLDLKMPKLDGIEVLKEIRKSKEYKSIPVIILTSSKMESDIARSYEFGANSFVVKPIDFAAFVEAIKNLGYFWANVNTSLKNYE